MIRKILFVDDDQIFREAVAQRLSGYRDNFGLITAADGEEAMEHLKNQPLSMVIVNLVMEGMDGAHLVEHLGLLYPDLPVIVMSNVGDRQLAEMARTHSAYGYLSKPFKADDLIAMIQEVLGREAQGGIMNDVSPPVFMQLMEMDARTCTIRILDNHSNQGGIVFFNQGELYNARVGDVHGIEAAYRMFGWDRTTVYIKNECDVSENLIEMNLGTIIMTAVGLKDENEERPSDYQEVESVASLSGEENASDASAGAVRDSTATDDDKGSLDQVRKKLKDIHGVISIGVDAGQNVSVENLAQLGKEAGFGSFVMASVDEDTGSGRIIVPTKPVGIIRSEPGTVSLIEKALKGNTPS